MVFAHPNAAKLAIMYNYKNNELLTNHLRDAGYKGQLEGEVESKAREGEVRTVVGTGGGNCSQVDRKVCTFHGYLLKEGGV